MLEDTLDYHPRRDTFAKCSYIARTAQQFDITYDLVNSFPNDLLNETKTELGMPDVTDGGGLYIEYNINGIHKFWLIDQIKQNVPQKYHAFMAKVNEKIRQLR